MDQLAILKAMRETHAEMERLTKDLQAFQTFMACLLARQKGETINITKQEIESIAAAGITDIAVNLNHSDQSFTLKIVRGEVVSSIIAP